MKNLSIFLVFAFMMVSCTTETDNNSSAPESNFENQLTDKEIEGGIMTPEILWKFGRIGGIQLSPDRNVIASSLTRYDSKTNKSSTNIFFLSTEGGDIEIFNRMMEKYGTKLQQDKRTDKRRSNL